MDRLTEMEVFTAVVDQGGFTDAARKMGISKSAVSKHIASLEARLGARLLNRTTRRVSPTEIGLAYYDRAQRVLTDAGEADALVSALQGRPAGPLRVSAATDFASHHVAPVLGGFLEAYPEITLSMELSNRFVDLISEGFDLAIRVGEMEDSSLRARKFAETRYRMIAAKSYLATMGHPKRIDDLGGHRLLHHTSKASGAAWRLRTEAGEMRQVRSGGTLMVNDGRSLLSAAEQGLGIAYLPEFLCAPALAQGRVVEVLPDLPEQCVGIFAVYPPGKFTQPKVRAFIDYLVDQFEDTAAESWALKVAI